MCPRFLFVDTNKSAHKGHHPHSHTWSTHGWNRTLTKMLLSIGFLYAKIPPLSHYQRGTNQGHGQEEKLV